jgi:hypothetical protein
MEVSEVTRKLGLIILGSLMVLAASLAAACGDDKEPARRAGQTPTPGTASPAPLATSVIVSTPTPKLPSGSMDIGPESVWGPLQVQASSSRLHTCRAPLTDCVTAIMQDSSASPQAIDFFRLTGWILSDIQELGRVDLGTIINPWRANDNVQFALLNGSPLVVYPEEEVRPVAIDLDPNYDALVALFPDLLLWPGESVYQGVAVSEQGGQGFVFRFSLVDGCHACGTLYSARVAFDFDTDGTYRGPRFMALCGGAPDVTPVATSVPPCPAP